MSNNDLQECQFDIMIEQPEIAYFILAMFEHHHQPLLPRKAFARRILLYIGIALGIVLVSLSIGILGYHFVAGFTWIDSLLNASMILGGMGPVNELTTLGSKIFASVYAIFSGVVFLLAFAVILTPVVHRFLHRFHIDMDSKRSQD